MQYNTSKSSLLQGLFHIVLVVGFDIMVTLLFCMSEVPFG